MINTVKEKIKRNKFIYGKYSKLYNLKFNIRSYIEAIYVNSNKLKQYKDIHKGERCFIIGNGPSLKVQDLEEINNEYSMASNRIFAIYNETSFRPTYYFAQDQSVIQKNIDEIKDLGGIKFIRSMGEKRYSDSSFIKFFINNFNYYSQKPPKFGTDITKFYDGYTVTYSMIQFAAYMGFNEIYLIGVDANYSISNGHIDSNSYFDKNVFDKDKIGGLPDIAYNFMAYQVAKDYADANNIKIYNATRGGMLEVFPRVDLDEVLGLK